MILFPRRKLNHKELNQNKNEVIIMNRRLMGQEKSLNDPIKDGENTEWQDWLVDEGMDQELLTSQKQELEDKKELLYKSIGILNEREKKILEDRRLSETPKTLDELSKKYIDELKYDYEDHYITDMWYNILRSGETHRPHTHSNNLVSGVFYLHCNDDSPAINFIDPRPQTTVLQPQQKEYTRENSTTWQVPAKINRMVLFPSWLQHYVPKNNSHDRISISFNVMLRGQVGRSENFQSNVF